MILSYIDPGTGSMLISATVALASVGFFMVKGLIYRKFGLGGNKGDVLDLKENRNIIIYSEGKQYWSVFQNIVEACSEEGIQISYFSSDRNDPGLSFESEFVERAYIGSGRESFFTMNRIKANIVLMTTPGLDVLELKRSKDVKHYIHITHATGSVSDYKAYGVDYFDSIMLGGNGDIELIRELENFRNLPEKRLEIVGHTYLDILREKAQKLTKEDLIFKNDKITVLISPTWGVNSLLVTNGEKLLKKFEDSEDYNIIIRPHPQSFVSDKDIMEHLMTKFPDNENRVWNRDMDNITAMYSSDIMISDFSGIIFDYYSLLKRPILTMHSLFKKEGLDSMDLKEDSWNISILNDIGTVIRDTDIDCIDTIVNESLNRKDNKRNSRFIDKMSMYEGQSKEKSIKYLKEILNSQQNELVYDSGDSHLPKATGKNLSNIKALVYDLFFTSILFTIATTVLSKLNILHSKNASFFEKLNKPSIAIVMVLFLIILSLIHFVDKGNTVFYKSREKFDFYSIALALVPMIPIIQYVTANQDILNFSSTFTVLGIFFLFSVTLIVLLPFILSPIISQAMSRAVLMSTVFTVYNMASYGDGTNGYIKLIILVVIAIFIYLLSITKKQTILVLISLSLFLTSTLSSYINMPNLYGSNEKITEKDREFIKYIDQNQAVVKPNIYFLIYDSYANEETFESYGYDNSSQMNYLLDEGFAIYDSTYSIGYTSLKTMANLLQTTRIVNDTVLEREIVAGYNTTMHMLNKEGYDSNIVLQSDYMFQGFTSLYSNTFPGPEKSIEPSKIIINAILEGEFRNDAEFSEVEYDDFIEVTNETLSRGSDKPKFYYTHDDRPGHTSFYRNFDGGEKDRYLGNIPSSNLEMKRNIEAIKSHDPNAIIAILGDHGPYISNGGVNMNDYVEKDLTQLDMQDRFGTFLAIHWPDKSLARKYDIKVTQDLMPAIIAYIYGDSNLFEMLRVERGTIETDWFGNTKINEGKIVGGPDNGKEIFKNIRVRVK